MKKICPLSQESLKKSKGIWLQRKKLIRIVREHRRELYDKNLSCSIEGKVLKKDKKEPLAPYPKKAILITRKAKWYCWEIEKYRIRVISRQSVAEEIRNIPARVWFFISDISTLNYS